MFSETLGEHFGALVTMLGACWEHFGSISGCFGESCLAILFVRGGRQNLALCRSFSNLVFMFFPEFPKMAEIVPNREIAINL